MRNRITRTKPCTMYGIFIQKPDGFVMLHIFGDFKTTSCCLNHYSGFLYLCLLFAPIQVFINQNKITISLDRFLPHIFKLSTCIQGAFEKTDHSYTVNYHYSLDTNVRGFRAQGLTTNIKLNVFSIGLYAEMDRTT